MIGGEGNRGYYFIGLDEDEENLLYLDPHCVNKHDDAQIDYNSYS